MDTHKQKDAHQKRPTQATKYKTKYMTDQHTNNTTPAIPSSAEGSTVDTQKTHQNSVSERKEIKNVFQFIQSKIEKLGTAVYMVTSYMPQDEPIRSSLRVAALSSTAHASHLSVRQHTNHFTDLEKDVVHILSLINLSHTLGIMSHMNGEILSNQYDKLLVLLRKQSTSSHAPSLALDTQFDAHYYGAGTSKGQYETPLETVTHSQETIAPIAPIAQPVPATMPRAVSGVERLPYITPKTKPTTTTTINKAENKERRSARQTQVLGTLSTERELGIKDIAARIKGCSEKTIQRELNELVERHKIRRIGEKRWSRYIKL